MVLKNQIAEHAEALQRRGAGTAALANRKIEQQVAASDRDRALRALATARAIVGQARAQLLREIQTAARHQVTAPCDGIVTERLLDLGAAIPMGTPVIHVDGPDKPSGPGICRCGSTGMFQTAQPVTISLRSLPGEALSGHIELDAAIAAAGQS
jgi:multidrug efflux pump subunit AcrA (membrane-fusion protein)